MARKRKFIAKNVRKRKLYFSLLLVCVLMIGLGYANLVSNLSINGSLSIWRYDHTLYGVLEKAYRRGTYAAKYTGNHQDSWENNGTKDIYHWYATSNANGTAIQDKNNVIFAGHCWQMIRTTDTGGVKMIYNGEAENNQCLNTRGTHVGYYRSQSQTMSTTYYYGTDYTYDSTNNVFSLSGTVTTGAIQIGQYTCRSTSSTGTCEALYLVYSLKSGTNYTVLQIKSNSDYSQFGNLEYNINYSTLSEVGYMYNRTYSIGSKSNSFRFQDLSNTFNTSYYYSDTVDYNNITPGKYTLTNPILISTVSDYSELVGKFILSTSGTTHTSVQYIVAVSGTTYYCKILTGGNMYTSLTVGDTYSESGGVYTLSGNVTHIPYYTWYNSSSVNAYKGKYVCDGNNTSCTNLKHINPYSNPKPGDYSYFEVNNNTYSYGEGVSYDGTTYTLTGDVKTFWDLFDSTNQSYLPTHHYICFNGQTSCTSVGHSFYFNINYTYGDSLYYVLLTGVADVEAALDDMLYASDVNTKSSTIKTGIEAWYVKYLAAYDSYIEDTIFCNDRTIRTLGGWNSNGGSLTSYLRFQENSTTKDLSCDRATDQFSTLNPNAQLTYKVGLMSSPEMNLLNNSNARVTGKQYWLTSPSFFATSYPYACNIEGDGSFDDSFVYSTFAVRPAISLKPGTEYVSGDGSMANPYVVDATPIEPESFATDSWETIVMAARTGNTSAYHVGDTKEIDMGSLGTHTLRIANMSTPSECFDQGFSQTACGFVLEFVDNIVAYNMNSTDTNVGGWPASAMRTYISNTIYNALPSDLKSIILDTIVVSGHGSTSGETNFTTFDKLYLLSCVEVYGSNNTMDTLTLTGTRQLDYYSGLTITSSNYSIISKEGAGSDNGWWFRTANANNTTSFYRMYSIDPWNGYGTASSSGGVSPAFRIG